MKTAKHPGVLAVVGIVCATALGGCASGRAVPIGAPAPVATPVLDTATQEHLPITAYELTPLEGAQENYLVKRLQQRCMSEFGLTYLPGLSTSSVSLGARIIEEIESRRYGVSDPVAVRTYGYQMPAWTMGTSAPIAIGSLPKPVQTVLLGTAKNYAGRSIPTGGCLAQAGQELEQIGVSATTQQTGGQDVSSLAGAIRSNDFQRAQSDPRVLKVFAKWSACMHTYGYSYATPFDATGDPRWSAPGPAGSAEIRTAERDLACGQTVNLFGVEFAVESDYEDADIARNAQAMAQAKAEVASEGADLTRAMAAYGN